MKKLIVGLVQHSCTEDREANMEKSANGIREAVSRGAELIVLQELHLGPYFCQTENPARFDLAEPIPGPATDAFGSLAAELSVVIVASIFERRAPVCITIRLWFLTKTARWRASTARCISPTTLAIMRSTISRRVTWGSIPLQHRSADWEYWSAGTSGIRKLRG